MSTATSNQGFPGSGLPTPSVSEPPPGSPLIPGKESVSVSVDTQTLLDYGAVFTFSPKTCSELLPLLSHEQLSYEVEFHQKLLGRSFDFKTRKPNLDAKTRALSMSLNSQITEEIVNLTYDCKAYKKLIFDLSCTVTRAQKYIDQMNVTVHRETEVDTAAGDTPPDTVTQDSEPVCFVKNLKIDRSISDFIADIDLEREGNRRVAYYGPVDYKYGRTHHKARDYPDSEHMDYVFNTISETLGDPDFNKINYSCLFTLYDDHKAKLNYHSDDELNILPGSKIITVSLGDSRCIKFRNTIGPLREVEYPLPHGSVHTMTQDSQAHWQHCIPESQSPCGPRLSLTFRRHTADVHKRHPPPPIHRPQSTSAHHDVNTRTPPSPRPSPARVLFLSDSIIMNFPVDVFPSNIGCIKKANFELFNISKYESEFSYTDIVVITCGINDLTRHNFTATKLLDFIIPKLNEYVVKYPNTTFIFNSLLYTVDPFFNREISIYNREIFNYSLHCDNIWFFDSHHLVSEGPNPIDLSDRGNGVHITYHAKKHISGVLRECIIKSCCSGQREIARAWPLRPEYRQVAVDYRSLY